MIMFDDSFYKKKQLLAQRDDLLEEIGLSIFEAGDLPDPFNLLPQEFHSMDILVRQLRDRYRSLREERDVAHLEYVDLLNRRARQDNEFDKKIRPEQQALDEVNLKIRYRKDQLSKSSIRRLRKNLDLGTMEEEANACEKKVGDLRRCKEMEQETLNEKMRPYEERLRKLDGAIRAVQEEEGQPQFQPQETFARSRTLVLFPPARRSALPRAS